MVVVRAKILIVAGGKVNFLHIADHEIPFIHLEFEFDVPDGLNDEEILEFAKKMVWKLYEESGMLIHGPVFVEGREEPIGWV